MSLTQRRHNALRWCTKGLLAFCVAISSGISFAKDELHAPFTALLSEHVVTINEGTSTQVDYAGFLTSKQSLDTYLSTLASVSRTTFDAWDSNTQLAFLINAYNAYTINLILTRYPDLGSHLNTPTLTHTHTYTHPQLHAPTLTRIHTKTHPH